MALLTGRSARGARIGTNGSRAGTGFATCSGFLKRDVQGRVHHCEIDTLPLDQAERWVGQVRSLT
jgi:hypothetical protein